MLTWLLAKIIHLIYRCGAEDLVFFIPYLDNKTGGGYCKDTVQQPIT
jgi:hypothetical protein